MTASRKILQHEWDVTSAQAIEIQKRLAGSVEVSDRFGTISTVAGVDVGLEQDGSVCRAAVVVLAFPSLKMLEHKLARRPVQFPYVPGLLSFRELPAVLQAIEKLSRLPDMFLCDGQGIAHPRRLGIATHLGLLLDQPSIGVGKTRLTGQHDDVPDTRGAWRPLIHRGEMVGAALRTRAGTRPVFVSTGHRVSLLSAIRITLACTTRYKLPETTRHAHRLASAPGP